MGPEFSDAEITRRRAAVDELRQREDLDAVVVYGANRFGSAVPWLTGWPVTREAVVVLRPGVRPQLFVSFPNHVPNARRIARDADVAGCGESTGDTVVEALRTAGPLR